jgi:hypothetical protein
MSRRFARIRTELARHGVAGDVQKAVVDLLEPVDVGHDLVETELAARARRTSSRAPW